MDDTPSVTAANGPTDANEPTGERDDITRADSPISVPARFRIVPTTPGAQRIA